MEKFFAAVRNMFNVPDLRRRIFFTLGLLAVYRFGAHVSAPGINRPRLEEVWRDVAGTLARRSRSFLRRQLSYDLRLRSRCHSLHHCVDHPSAHDRRLAATQEVAGRRRDGTAEDQSVDSLSHRNSCHGANIVRRALAAS